MAAEKLVIDHASVTDNVDARLVEFTAEVDGDEREFAVQYDVLQALSGDEPDGDADAMFRMFEDDVVDAALASLARDGDQNVVLVSENDLE